MPQIVVPSPVGSLSLGEKDGKIVQLGWYTPARTEETPLLREARRQLMAYFEGRLRDFDLPLSLAGSAFYHRVWQAMQHIPYGATRSYGELAHETDSGPRAVGGACGKNPIAIILPCPPGLASGGAIRGCR